jgi:hypothetical protein
LKVILMKTVRVLLLLGAVSAAHAESLMYRGMLSERGQPANGVFALKLTLEHRDGRAAAAPIELRTVNVHDGSFAQPVVFDGVSAGNYRVRAEIDVNGRWISLGEPRPVVLDGPNPVGCWGSEGNLDTDGLNQYVGTSDNRDFYLGARRAPLLRISATIINGEPVTTRLSAGSPINRVSPSARGGGVAGGGSAFEPLAGSQPNQVFDSFGVIAGGRNNAAGFLDDHFDQGAFAVVRGGENHSAQGLLSVVGGGALNATDGNLATIGGGFGAVAGEHAVVSGGLILAARGVFSSVPGGQSASAVGHYSTAAGASSCAGGESSVVLGFRATVRSPAGNLGCSVQTNDANGDEGSLMLTDGVNQLLQSAAPNRIYLRYSDAVQFQAQIGSESAALPPRGFFGVAPGASGHPPASVIDPTTVLALESSQDGFVRQFTPDGFRSGVWVSTPNGADRGGIEYAAGAGFDTLTVSAGGAAALQINASQQVTLPSIANFSGSLSVCRSGAKLGNCSSSARYKSNLNPLRAGTELIHALRPVSYVWNADGAPDIGFVAEDVAALDGRLITRNAENQIEGVRYDRMTAPLVDAVHALEAQRLAAARARTQLNLAADGIDARLQAIANAIETR